MNLKFSIILFIILLSSNLLGKKALTLNIYEKYYVFNYMEFVVALCTILLGVFLTFQFFKVFKKKNQ